ncbi:MAG TPA: SCO family protein [Candidatus Dormibacteraeota bacterium]|nr:SCO family protein [Candidatus Dormibacteraeota bacterium]
MRSLLAIIILCAIAVTAQARAAGAPASAALVDQTGRSFTLASLRGRPVVLTFVATRCTDACPVAEAAFLALQSRLPAARAGALLLTITLDPAYDTPFVMARTAQAIGADPRRWRFASGRPRDVAAVMRAFGVAAERGRDGVPELHSTLIYVLDRRGAVAKRLLLSTNTVSEVVRALSAGGLASR